MPEEQKKPTLTELSLEKHANLKMDPKGVIAVAKSQHIISLKVSEVGMAASSFPIFLSRPAEGAEWALSAINSYELDSNLFVENDTWTATHMPIGMQTYPFFLMRSERDEKSFTIGIDEQNRVFSETEGEALFEDGKASLRLSQATAQLELEVKHDVHTYKFAKQIEELGLIKDIDLQVHYQSGLVNTLKGLCTIDEQALYDLDAETFAGLRKEGYLMPLYVMLTSIYQFNNLIKIHNRLNPEKTILQVKLEVPKEEASA